MDGPEFVRLHRGRVWHVRRPVLEFAGAEEDLIAAAWCGESWKVGGDQQPEQLTAHIPQGGRICWRCVVEVNSFRSVVLGVAATDRRPEISDAWPKLLDHHDDDDDVVDAEIVEDWPCSDCGHSNLDHDGDWLGPCTVTSDNPAVEWAECPCGGLTED